MSRPVTPHLPILLGLLIAVGPISTDMYLPAFPAIALTLHNQAVPQYSLASYFLGLAVGQLVIGPFSDSFGRRTPLLVGLGVYIFASLGAALSWDVASLVAFRFLAALGASAAIVIPRAVVRDLADGPAAAKLMSKLMLAMGLAPICAPLLGVLCAAALGWRFIFLVCTFYGVMALFLAYSCLPDTLPSERRIKSGPVQAFIRYTEIFREPAFFTHAIINACVAACLFAYLGGTPQVFEGFFHWSSAEYALLFGVNSFAYIGYSQLNPILVNRFSVASVISAAIVWQLLCAISLAIFSTHNFNSLFLAAGLLFCEAAFGLLLPCCMVGALSRHRDHAGAAAALLGTLQYIGGAIAGLGVGILADGTAKPMAIIMLGSAAIAALAATSRPRLKFELAE